MNSATGGETATRPQTVEHQHAGPAPRSDEHGGEKHELSENSPWPPVLALGLLLVSVGLLSHPAVSIVGAVVTLVALVGWLWQPWVS